MRSPEKKSSFSLECSTFLYGFLHITFHLVLLSYSTYRFLTFLIPSVFISNFKPSVLNQNSTGHGKTVLMYSSFSSFFKIKFFIRKLF